MNILVVNEDVLQASALRVLLESMGHEVSAVPDLSNALEQVKRSAPAVLILDQELPEQSETDVRNWVNEVRTGRQLYFLMLTSGNESASAQAELEAALEVGMDDIVAKPIKPLDLVSRLRSAERVIALQLQLREKNRDLELAYESLQGEFESLSSDLAVASTVQQALLPEPGRFSHLTARGFLRSAKYMAGDSYDYFLLGDHHLAFYLADVVGHGSAAALVSFALNHQITPRARGMCQTRFDAAETLDEAVIKTVQDLNDQFSHDGEHNRWFTMIYGLVDLESGEVVMCQAGHPPGLHHTRQNERVTEVGTGGFPVGMFQDVPYSTVQCRLSKGDRLLLCSDGALECFSSEDEEFGVERMKQVLQDYSAASLEQLMAGINDRLEDWHQEESFDDDVSVLIFEYLD